MSDSIKATRAPVQIGALAVDGFMLPDGGYRMSQAQAAQAIRESPVYALRFLQSKDSKALLGEIYTDYTPESVEVEPELGKRGQTRINALSLERRFDDAFGVSRTEQERNTLLTNRIQQLEQSLQILGETFAIDDVARQERDYFERLLMENGINPWKLPEDSQSEE